MQLNEFLNNMYMLCSNTNSRPTFFDTLIENYISPEHQGGCKLLSLSTDAKARYFNGRRSITKENAKYIYRSRDVDKFAEWIEYCLEKNNTLDGMTKWLKEYGYSPDPTIVGITVTEIFDDILSLIISGRGNKKKSSTLEKDKALLKEIDDNVKQLSQPTSLSIPPSISSDEELYVKELYKAYGEKTSTTDFSKEDLLNFSYLEDDFKDRRMEFYAAESIRRGLQEVTGSSMANQFEVLKDETYAGVNDIARFPYSDGYIRLLKVMSHVTNLQMHSYLLKDSPYWLNNSIKKGVCHHLVNDNRLRWVIK